MEATEDLTLSFPLKGEGQIVSITAPPRPLAGEGGRGVRVEQQPLLT